MTIKKGNITIASSTPTTEWGSIDGTLSDQVDLKNALDTKAPTLSPTLTGIPTAPTAQQGTNTNQIATTKFVKTEINTAIENIDVLPSQTGQSGKFLTTNGTVASWADPTSKTIITLTSDQSSYTLTSNNIYSVSISGSITTITFVLNIPSNTNVSNDIIVHAYIGANSPTITWGTQHFFNAEVPSIVNSGYYDITYVYNPLASYWVCKLNLVEADL